MKNILYIVFVLLTGLYFGCSELQKNVTPVEPTTVFHDGDYTDPNSPDFHGKVIQMNNWDMTSCKKCHANNYQGGTALAYSKSEFAKCTTCHNSPNGPEACNTCHGDLTDVNKIYPPRGLSGNTSTTDRGVGAHVTHLVNSNYSLNNAKCTTCHIVPAKFSDASHINGTVVVFNTTTDSLLKLSPNVTYSSSSISCSNTYCHGNWSNRKVDRPLNYQGMYTDSIMRGNNLTMVWNKVTNQNLCGSCHGTASNPSPVGHAQVAPAACPLCHGMTVGPNLNIIDKSKHINGKADVQLPFRKYTIDELKQY